MDGFVNQSANSVRSHCLSPARARVAIDAPLGPASYARMFPDLPSFQADEQFLRALGSVGGICDCGDVDDSPEALGDTAAGWPIFGQFVAHDITANRSILRSHTNTAELRNARSPQLNLVVKMPGRGHALTIDAGRREVAEKALEFVKRFTTITARAA